VKQDKIRKMTSKEGSILMYFTLRTIQLPAAIAPTTGESNKLTYCCINKVKMKKCAYIYICINIQGNSMHLIIKIN
jgi:hypothetical protein